MEPGTWFVQLATGYQYVINVTHDMDGLIHFDQCAWIATTGIRTGRFLREGIAPETEVEVLLPGHFLRDAVVGRWRWPHPMPEKDQ